MMRAGVLILLFVAYQLWGTGFATARAQDRLDQQFSQQLDAFVPPAPEAAGEPVTAPADLPIPASGDPIARLEIPSIGVDFIMVQGVELDVLKDGPGHFPQTPLPGQPGNSAVAGHRTTYKAPFHRIDEMTPGEEITVTTLQGSFTYRVDAQPDGRGHFIVQPDALSILRQDIGNRLTLMACHPKYSAAQRIVVTATLVSNPAPITSQGDVSAMVTDDASQDPLAGGDPTAWPEAIGWSLLSIAVWFGVWFLARIWRRIPAYALGVPVFAVVLFIAFENIARLLPASY